MKLSNLTLFLGSSALLLTACMGPQIDQAENKAPNEKTAPHDHGDHKTAKLGGAIDITSDYDGKASVSEVKNITLFFADRYDNGTLRVTLTPSEGMELYTPSETSFSLSGADTNSMDVSLSLTGEGTHYLNIMAVAKLDDGRAFPATRSISFNVGNGTPEKPGFDKEIETPKASGEIIEMQAEETIKSGSE